MSENTNILDDKSRLILHRTPREDIKNGITHGKRAGRSSDG